MDGQDSYFGNFISYLGKIQINYCLEVFQVLRQDQQLQLDFA
jgi:hypothetical protein